MRKWYLFGLTKTEKLTTGGNTVVVLTSEPAKETPSARTVKLGDREVTTAGASLFDGQLTPDDWAFGLLSGDQREYVKTLKRGIFVCEGTPDEIGRVF